jgi:hypothetical protein
VIVLFLLILLAQQVISQIVFKLAVQ